jgi:perosamine synthetase
MIPLAIPDLSGNEARYLQECVESNFVSSVGPFVDRFEGMVSDAVGAAAAIAVSSGTTGLHAALNAVGVGPGDLVILPAYTFIASANAISHCGAMPWLFDIDPDSWTLDANLLKASLETETERQDSRLIHRASGRCVTAIMPVYAFGLPADMDPIIETAKAFSLPVVADAAAAIGATYKGRIVGDLGADLSVFSFNGNKTVTAGGGGAIAGHDRALLERIRHLTTTARVGPDYTHDQIGFNYRMTNLQAAVGCAQMERFEGLVAAKRRIRAHYDSRLAEIPGLAPFPAPSWAESACWISGALCSTEQQAAGARKALDAAGFDAKLFWKPMHLQPPYADTPTTAQTHSNKIWKRILPLPNSTSLTLDEQDLIIEALVAWAD